MSALASLHETRTAFSPTEAFAHRSLCTEQLIHTEAFRQRSLYTQKLWHSAAFTQRPFTHRRFDTEQLLHTEAFTHRSFYTEQLYTQKLLHKAAFTQRSFSTGKPLHRAAFTQTRCYTGKPLHRAKLLHKTALHKGLSDTDPFTQRRLYTKQLLDRNFYIRNLYTDQWSAFTHRSIFTERPLHTKNFYTDLECRLLRKAAAQRRGQTWATSFDGKHATCLLVTGQFWSFTSIYKYLQI